VCDWTLPTIARAPRDGGVAQEGPVKLYIRRKRLLERRLRYRPAAGIGFQSFLFFPPAAVPNRMLPRLAPTRTARCPLASAKAECKTALLRKSRPDHGPRVRSSPGRHPGNDRGRTARRRTLDAQTSPHTWGHSSRHENELAIADSVKLLMGEVAADRRGLAGLSVLRRLNWKG
jgi:hypothetical protein